MSMPENLPENTVALFRLPLSVQRLSEICRMFSGEGYRIAQVGEWVMIEKEVKP